MLATSCVSKCSTAGTSCRCASAPTRSGRSVDASWNGSATTTPAATRRFSPSPRRGFRDHGMGQGGPAAQPASKPPRLRCHGPPIVRVRRTLDRPPPRRLSGGSHGGFRQLVSETDRRLHQLLDQPQQPSRATRSSVRSGHCSATHRASVEILESPAQTARAIDLYQHVHAESWKEPEPYPNFIPTLIATGLGAGAIRVGVLMVDDEPVAAQLWIVWNRRATIFKLSYVERFARSSPARS